MICLLLIYIHSKKSYLVTELLDTDLKKVIEKEHAKLTDDHFKLFLYQILRALKYMHSGNILHRDLVKIYFKIEFK
jgi:mitogen-activated protein kinase 1/3